MRSIGVVTYFGNKVIGGSSPLISTKNKLKNVTATTKIIVKD